MYVYTICVYRSTTTRKAKEWSKVIGIKQIKVNMIIDSEEYFPSLLSPVQSVYKFTFVLFLLSAIKTKTPIIFLTHAP
jgi:hypothetical protein